MVVTQQVAADTGDLWWTYAEGLAGNDRIAVETTIVKKRKLHWMPDAYSH